MNIAITSELKRIAVENGGIIKPETVVAEAEPESSPLHDRFEWDDTKAGHHYRLWQARKLISVCIEVINVGARACDVFVSLTPDREVENGGYRMMIDVMSDAELRAQLLRDALHEMKMFRDKYQDLKELAAVFAAMDDFGVPA